MREQYERFRPNVVLIEDKASGTQLIQELIREGLCVVTRGRPQSDEVMPMQVQTAMIEKRLSPCAREGAVAVQYLSEMTVFPNGRDGDQVPPGHFVPGAAA